MATVSGARLSLLIKRAAARDFSRKGRGLIDIDYSKNYIVTPFLQEGTPEPCWICFIVEMPDPRKNIWRDGIESTRYTLDVSFKDFRSLKKLKGRNLDYVAHVFTWASTVSPNGK